jgi:uncharacterized protein YqgV (UPF0045/DUF77 family)
MELNPDRTVNVAVQVLPLVQDFLPAVDSAIAVIDASGVHHEVGPMETTMQGRLDRLLEIARQAHLAAMRTSGGAVVTLIKIGDRPQGTTMAEKVEKHRRGGSPK